MSIVERHVQYRVKDDKAYRDWEKSWAEVEARLGGFPPKRHLTLVSGTDYAGTWVWEREWESMAALEAANERLFADPEAQPLFSTYGSILEGERIEFYFVEPI